MSILNIDLKDLRSGSYKVEGRIQAHQLKFTDATEVVFSGPLVLRVRISTTDWLTYSVSGSISFKVAGECLRCLKEITHEQRTKISGVFAFPVAIAKLNLTEQQLGVEGIFSLESAQKTIDLADLVRESVFLDYPRYLRCSEDCKGLCPVCGCYLDEENCNCQQKEIDPRWAKLAELKRK